MSYCVEQPQFVYMQLLISHLTHEHLTHKPKTHRKIVFNLLLYILALCSDIHVKNTTGLTMATFSTERKLPSKTVQELAISCEDVPKQYIYSEEAAAVIRANVSSGEIPVIDLSLLSSPSPEGIEELMKFRSALSSWGCFQAINHGIESSILHNLHDVIKDFFKLPVAEKQRCSRNVNDMEGYGNETIFSEDQVLDWCDRLYLKIYPQDKRQLSVWPENPPAFREIVHKYSLHLKAILEIVLKAMARSLNLEENCFIDQYGERGFMQARFTYYPRCPRPDSVLGLKPHADGPAITVLLQDKEVQGLQFLKDDQWFKVPVNPNALIVNLGDQAEIMSNGIFKSPIHRVLTNSERERISMAVFCSPDPESEIQPLEELVQREGKRRYKNVKDYLNNFFEHYQQGKRPIDVVRL